MTAPPRSASVLLADALRLLEDQQGWEDIALEVIEAAQQRLAGVPLTEELEMWLLLGGRLAAGRWTVGSALSVIDALPADFDPFGRCRPAEGPYRRSGVQHLAVAAEASP